MLNHLDTDALAELAANHGVKIDKRWKRDRIIKKLEDAGIEPPELGDGLTDRMRQEPVRFVGGTGRIHVRNARYKQEVGADRELIPGLVVDFFDINGEPVGGFSREFYPDLPDCEEHMECSCAACLAEVRDYISADRYGIAEQFYIREADVNEPAMPLPNWSTVNAGDVTDLHGKLGFDLANAVRYELRNANRHDVLAALDAIDAKADTVQDEDILDAELTV